jgi:hypothetical protein
MIEVMMVLCFINLSIQNLEYFRLRHHFEKGELWPWEIIRSQFTDKQNKVLDFFLKQPNFTYFILARQILTLLSLFYQNGFIYFLLLLSTLLIGVRFRGSFNGGSDYMTTLTLLAMTFQNEFVFLYLGLQVILSYFLAGWHKLKNPHWRIGLSLKNILTLNLPNGFYKMMAWAVILFELSFPFCLLGGYYLWTYLGLGILFHLTNVYTLGLNRFFWSWISAYPAVVFMTQYLN